MHDITPVNVQATQVAAALQGDSADVGIEVERLSAYLQANRPARVIAHPAAVTEKSDFLVATQSALANKAANVNVNREFDPRFSSLVAEGHGS